MEIQKSADNSVIKIYYGEYKDIEWNTLLHEGGYFMKETTLLNLSDVRNILLKEISNVSFETFNQRLEEKWSIAQICHHLVLVELATTKAIQYGIKAGRNEVTRKNVQTLLNRFKKIKSPQLVEPDEHPFEVQEIIELLSNSRGKLLSIFDGIEHKGILSTKSVRHPVFGELALDQWVEMVYLHEQRHIEQIKEIKVIVGL